MNGVVRDGHHITPNKIDLPVNIENYNRKGNFSLKKYMKVHTLDELYPKYLEWHVFVGLPHFDRSWCG